MAKKGGNIRYILVAVLAFFLCFFSVGAIVTAYSTTSYYVMQEWGINNTQNGTMTMVRTIFAVIAMYLCSIYYRKLPIRIGLPIGLLLGAVGYAIFAVASDVVLGNVAMAILGLAHGLSGMYAVTLLVNRWFVKRKGLVLGIVTTGPGFTTMIMPPMLVYLVDHVSLAFTFWVVAAIFAVLAVLAFLLVVNYPADVGMTAYGDGEVIEEKKTRTVTDRFAPTKGHLALMLLTAFLIGPICYTQGQLRTLAFTSNGWSIDAAATATALYGLMVIIGKLIYGPITDRWSFRKSTIPFFLILGASHVMLAMAGQGWFNMFAAQVANFLYGVGGPVCTVGLALYGIEMSPKGQQEKWASYYLVSYNVGALIFNQIAGIMADAAGGSYNGVFIMFAIFSVIAGLTSQIAYSGAYKNYQRLNAHAEN